ncbi:T9SS type A sorting domain-containing protein, partial [Aureispira]|nr:T9SS type A sorting domain-containing protein [Aureispira sp.]
TLDLIINYSNSGTDVITACDRYTWIDGVNYTSSNNSATHTLTNADGCDSVVTLDLTINYSNTGTDVITACDSYTWIDGVNYTTSNNSATHTLTNNAGCDSVVTLDLTINYSNSGTDVITACDSYTWIDGNTYTTSNNSATHTLTNANGCDSVVTLDLTINYSNTGTDSQTACDSYTWIDSITYTASNNSATHVLTNSAGCDSVVTLDLTINNSNTGTDTQTACDTFTWIDGNTYTTSNNSATHTLTNTNGCDSVVTLDLTINYSNTGTDVITACDSYTWIDGNTYTASNNAATHTLTNTAGCDSVVTLNMTINYANTGTDVITACDSYTWIDGNTYTTSNNSATHTLTNTDGCDSVVTLDLTINYSNTGTDVITACDNYTWIDGNTYNTSNNSATHTLTNADGCDSIVTLDLTINYSNTGTDVITACDSYTWIDGNSYTTSNNSATHTLTNTDGCDSVVTLDLTILNSSTGTDTQTVCDSFTWIDGNTYTNSNNSATHTLTNAAGCDSLVTLDLTINNATIWVDTIIACDRITWIDSITYTSSNYVATHLLTNSAGCDSLVKLHLTILYSTYAIDSITVCDSLTWLDSITYTSSTSSAIYITTNHVGCDSIITLNLTVINSTNSIDTHVACDSFVWMDSITYTSSNDSATYTLTNSAGCDSLVTLDLTMLYTTLGTDTQTACDSFVWIDSITYTASNDSATYSLTNSAGCDSIVTLDLTVLYPTTGIDTQIACNNFVWIDSITYNSSNDSATYTLTNSAGCDSIITLDLTIINIDTSLYLSNDTIYANQSGASYQWLDCDSTMGIILGANMAYYQPPNNGTFAVEINIQGCIDTSICLNINTIAYQNLKGGNQVIIYPNPTDNFVTIEFDIDPGAFELQIIDAAGRLLGSTMYNNQKSVQVPMPYPSGVYLLSIQTKNDRLVFPVIKE